MSDEALKRSVSLASKDEEKVSSTASTKKLPLIVLLNCRTSF